MPTIAIFVASPTFQCFSGTYVVMPAHSSGAASSSSRLSGIVTTKRSSTTICRL